MWFRVLFVALVVGSIAMLLMALSTSGGANRTRAELPQTVGEAGATAARPSLFCTSRMWEEPFNGTISDEVALQFIRLDEFGDRVLTANGCWRLVNFWATWCEPCRKEMPELVRLADRFRAHGLEVVTVNLEPPQVGDKALDFLRDHNANLVNFRLDIPDTKTIAALLDDRWQGGVPFTMVINPVGNLVFWHHGLFDVEEVERQFESRLMPPAVPGLVEPLEE